MKKEIIQITFFLFLTIMSCSSDDSNQNPIDIITRETPWEFDRSEVKSIDSNEIVLSNSDIEELKNTIMKDYNNAYVNSKLSFKINNTGIYDSPGYCQNCPISWTYLSGYNLEWSHRVTIEHCEITNTKPNEDTELNWKLKDFGGYYNHNDAEIMVRYDLNLIFK